jgi:hypothetical protein
LANGELPKTCEIDMVNFVQAPFDLDADDFLIARVRVLAEDLFWSDYSLFSSGDSTLLVK